jgi:hypothetical protein
MMHFRKEKKLIEMSTCDPNVSCILGCGYTEQIAYFHQDSFTSLENSVGLETRKQGKIHSIEDAAIGQYFTYRSE